MKHEEHIKKTTDGSVVAATTQKPTVVAEQPKPAETVKEAPKAEAPKVTPVNDRLYRFKAAPSVPPRGRQRQIVLDILQKAKEPIKLSEVTKLATEAGLQAVGGVGPSCRYHLHHMCLLGIAEVVNPKTDVTTEPVKEAAAAA